MNRKLISLLVFIAISCTNPHRISKLGFARVNKNSWFVLPDSIYILNGGGEDSAVMIRQP